MSPIAGSRGEVLVRVRRYKQQSHKIFTLICAGCCGRKDELDREDDVGEYFDAERLLSSTEEVGLLKLQ